MNKLIDTAKKVGSIKITKIFYMPEYQIDVNEIKIVKILKGSYCSILDRTYLPRIIINDTVFEGQRSIEVIDALLACGYYTPDQYKQTKLLMKSLLACITEGEHYAR